MNKMINKEECKHNNTRITLWGLWQCLDCGAMLDERPNITRRKSRNRITEEIKKTFKEFKKNNPRSTVCESLPFSPKNQLWMYYFLYPELLIMYDEWAEDKKFDLTNCSGEVIIFPCWVLPEDEVIRIMKECRILERGKNE